MAHDGTINIFVENLGRYNEGHIVGAWIPLPMQRDELWETIRKACKVDALHEEVFIADVEYDFGMPNVKIGEYDSIDDVNALAAAIENAENWDVVDGADAYAYEHNLSIIQTASILHDDNGRNIPWFHYATDSGSKEYRYGWTLVHETDTELSNILHEYNVTDYFDYEKYGSGPTDDTLFDNGYLMYTGDDPDTDSDAEEILSDYWLWTDDEDEDVDE